jgi:putative transposase
MTKNNDQASYLHRQSIRLKGYDYSLPGGYFVTFVSFRRECIFGDVYREEMRLNEYGQIVTQTSEWLSTQYPYIEFVSYIVMPNHFHGILQIIELDDYCRGGSRPAPTKLKTLGQIIGAFKTVSAKRINQIRYTSGSPVWQRNFYDHIIRDEKEYKDIWNYIDTNPTNWLNDHLYPLSNTPSYS